MKKKPIKKKEDIRKKKSNKTLKTRKPGSHSSAIFWPGVELYSLFAV